MLERTVSERFWAKVERWDPDECWEWTGAVDRYARFSVTHRRLALAHRWAYEALVGPIPDGLQIDHLCRNKSCVNPKHLEPVTSRTNSIRDRGWAAVNARKTHCKRGHLFDEANTKRVRFGRACRKCAYAQDRQRRVAKRVA